MATNIKSKGMETYVSQVANEVEGFERACNLIDIDANQGRYTVLAASEESVKLGSAFKRVLERIQETQAFFANGNEIKEGCEEQFFILTDMDSKVRASFSRACGALEAINPAIEAKKIELLSEKATEAATRIYVYYDGVGDLFVRGENAQIHLPAKTSASLAKPLEYGGFEELSWERGLPLTQIADHLWTTTLVAKEGEVPKYKYLIHDCTWSTGPDYQIKGEKSLIQIPTFDENSCSLLAPMDVGYGNKLVLFGEGEVVVQGKQLELSWKEGVDFSCFGPNLWVLPLIAKGNVEYKICLDKKLGEMIWEKGENRKLTPGKELVVTPNFGPGIGRIEPMEVASAALNTGILEQQELIQQRMEEEKLQIEAQVKVRQFPCLLKNAGKSFKDDEIIRVADPTDIKNIEIDGEFFQFYFTNTGKSVIVQEAPKGCTAGVSAMLIIDNGKFPRAKDLKERKGATDEQIALDITNAGLEPLLTPVSKFKRSVAALREQILAHGPAYVRTKQGPTYSGHAMIVDEISEDLGMVRIRDPWHGWDFIVTGPAFQRVWNHSLDQCEAIDGIVQVKNGVK